MPRFEVYCPAAPPLPGAATLQIDAEHWLAALKIALQRTGRPGPAASILCDVQADGSIKVGDPGGGGIVWIREIRDTQQYAFPGAAAAPAAQAAAGARAAGPGAAPAAGPAAGPAAAAGAAPERPAPPRAAPPVAAAKAAEAAVRAAEAAHAAKAAADAAQLAAREAARGHMPARTEDLLPAPEVALAQLPLVDRKTGLDRILDVALAKVDAEAGSILLVRPGDRELEFVVVRGPAARKLLALRPVVPVGSGVVGYCVRENVALAVSDVTKDPRFLWAISLAVQFETRSILCAPIAREGKVLGAIEVLNKRDGAPFCADDLAALTDLARHAAEHLARSEG